MVCLSRKLLRKLSEKLFGKFSESVSVWEATLRVLEETLEVLETRASPV
jgi:hypothetical protein